MFVLFEDFMDDPANQDFSMDNGLVCRWMTAVIISAPHFGHLISTIEIIFRAS